MRYSDIFGLATRSGANVRNSPASRSTSAIIGARSSCSYWSLRALNHSRSLFRFSARRNDSAFGLKRIALPRRLRHALLHPPSDMRHEPDHPLDEHQLAAVMHLVLLRREQHLEPALRDR